MKNVTSISKIQSKFVWIFVSYVTNIYRAQFSYDRQLKINLCFGHLKYICVILPYIGIPVAQTHINFLAFSAIFPFSYHRGSLWFHLTIISMQNIDVCLITHPVSCCEQGGQASHYPKSCRHGRRYSRTRVYPQVSGLAVWSQNCK
jgi:hypothetical protein